VGWPSASSPPCDFGSLELLSLSLLRLLLPLMCCFADFVYSLVFFI
jgi:hypothetical protein